MAFNKTVFQFKADLNKFAQQIDADVALVRKAISFQLMERVVSRTPVDTGRARASWNIADGAPDDSVAAEGKRDPAAAIDEALAKRLQADFSQPFSITWISNALPYAEALEFGSSQQAPNGMVRIALSEIEAGVIAALK